MSSPGLLLLVFMWFNAHTSLPVIYKDLKISSNDHYQYKLLKMKSIISISYYVCLIIYVLIGIFGYATYGDSVSLVFLATPESSSLSLFSFTYFIYILYCYISLIHLSFSSVHILNEMFTVSKAYKHSLYFERIVYCLCICIFKSYFPSLDLLTLLNCCIPGLFLEIILPSFFFISVNHSYKLFTRVSYIFFVPKRYQNAFLCLVSFVLFVYSLFSIYQAVVM